MRPIPEDPALNWDLGPPPRPRRMLIVVVSIVGAILLAAGAWQVMRPGSDPAVVASGEPVGDTVLLAPPSGYEGRPLPRRFSPHRAGSGLGGGGRAGGGLDPGSRTGRAGGRPVRPAGAA
ncbi:hypothetical protein ACFQX6_43575 [Streptosporangium lutulentum]